MAKERTRAQAFVEPRSEDPEGTSALATARVRLAAGERLEGVRRLRLFEIAGSSLDTEALAGRLHGSTQFYNPVKERCVLRTDPAAPPPAAPEEALVLVVERGGDRRPAAERWWRHETGERVEVREGVVWALRFAPGTDAGAAAEALACARERGHGLFANPHAQDHRVCAGAAPPLDWITAKRARRGGRTT